MEEEEAVSVDYEGFVDSLLTLLDLIEMTTDEERTQQICRQRFNMAEAHGMVVEFSAPSSHQVH